MKSNNNFADMVVGTMLADLWERDIAELKRTKQPGGEAFCRKLKRGVKEMRQFSALAAKKCSPEQRAKFKARDASVN